MANLMDPKALARRSLDRKLAPFRASDLARPPKGWVRAIRDALGMTTRDLAARLGVSQPSVVALEKGEAQDSVTLGTLRNAAEAMGCRLVYALVPDQPLEETLRSRARLIVDQNMSRVSHSMRLEDQGVGDDDLAHERERLVDEMLRGNLSRLWGSR